MPSWIGRRTVQRRRDQGVACWYAVPSLPHVSVVETETRSRRKVRWRSCVDIVVRLARNSAVLLGHSSTERASSSL